MRWRHFILLAIALLIVAAVVAVLLRRGAPPEAARLLPAAAAYVYLDLKPLRAAGLFKNMPSLDPDYAQFVRDTGFQFERDLDEAAFAVHFPSPTDVANSKTLPETRYSEVFVGRFDGAKLAAFLRRTAATTRNYGNSIIYEIPLPGRTVRVVVLSKNMVAVSNAEGEFVIGEVIDRYRQSFVGGSDMLRSYYRHVPLASVAWAVARTTSTSEPGNARFVLPGGYDLFFPQGTVVVAAVRYLGSVQFRADVFTRSQEDAQRVSDQLNAFLAVARTIEARAQGGSADPDLKSFFDSISVSQMQDRAELNAIIPPGLLKKIVSEAPPVPVVAPAPLPEAKKSTTEKRRHGGRKKK
ncbi:MAG: hypothetical protein LAN64_19115 [Acidobacteriia bacterium]|nr:hypothetical protein [Terriglobia bacterium]